jgi:hypothetical protein
MSLSSIASSAFAQAQSTLAQLRGADPTAEGNFLWRSQPFTGVFGTPTDVEPMMLGGGRRRREEIALDVTRSQSEFQPVVDEQIVRTDLSPPVTYTVLRPNGHDAAFWRWVLVRFD